MTSAVSFKHQNRLVSWFANAFETNKDRFPGLGSRNYPLEFLNIENYLNEKVHPTVVAHARIADSSGYLTDHGPGHILRSHWDSLHWHRYC